MPLRLLLLPLLCLPFLAQAQTTYTPATVPDPMQTGTGYMSDPDGIISDLDRGILNQLITEMEDSTTAQVAVVILNSIGEANPKDFATELFNLWGIGQAGKDNGLLILTVMDQRRTEFETGYGLEGVLPDVVCYRIGMQELVPYFREGDYGQGLIAAVEAFKRILEEPEAAEEISAYRPGVEPVGRGRNGGWFLVGAIYLLLLIVFHIYALSRLANIIRSREELYDKYLNVRKLRQVWALFVFPLPYILVYLFLNRRMKTLRDAPRFSRQTGVPMHRLTEQADDAHLLPGQITEEDIGSVDYDVWVPEDDSDVLILRYDKLFSKYNKCPSCGFKSYHHARTQTITPATYSSSGKKRIVWECKNCHYEKVTYKTIPKKTQSSSSGGFSGGGGGGGSWGGGSSGGGGAGVSW